MKISVVRMQEMLKHFRVGLLLDSESLVNLAETAIELYEEQGKLDDRNIRLQREVEYLTELLNTPLNHDWFQGVQREIGHQLQRWASEHDSGKTPADWFWLIGYLSQKAMMAQLAGDTEKAVHHTITTGAALFHWHRSITGENTQMRPGIAAPEGGDL